MTEDKKYTFTGETIKIKGTTLHRIKALKSFGGVKEGELGGFIEKEENLSHGGKGWVYDEAKVFGNAEVWGNNARIYDKSEICGDVKIWGDTVIRGNSKLDGKAQIYDDVDVQHGAKVYGGATMYDGN